MGEYINPNTYTVYLVGQDGKQIAVRSKQKVNLDEYFDRYCGRGYIRKTSEVKAVPKVVKPNRSTVSRTSRVRSKLQLTKSKRKPPPPPPPPPPANENRRQARAQRQRIDRAKKIIRSKKPERGSPHKRIVGRRINADANELLRINLDKSTIPISNNIGIGILSYNRFHALKRLVDSILATTDVHKTTIFISDDVSTDPDICHYLNQLSDQGGIVVVRNKERLGVAGNSNRLIRCLSRFRYGLILNDDIEVLQQGWEYVYVDAMIKTGMHHFMYRQEGVYGADRGTPKKVKDVDLLVVDERPHGAVLAFDREMLTKCGYFDESYGLYGMEHVDWSQRVWEFSLQQPGFWDVAGSENYFHLHSDKSIVDHKSDHLKNAKILFKKRTPTRCGPTETSRVPEITYIVPVRNLGRESCINAVVNNIRAQHFPVIHIILVEQDNTTKIEVDKLLPVYYYLVPDKRTELFNKSLAFNYGVSKAITEKLILHDADMLVQGNYTTSVANILQDYEGCHMGKTVLYADNKSTDTICSSGVVDKSVNCERIVGYFEGGSLACRKSTYWNVGGFCEDFYGYGCFAPGNLVATQRGYVAIENVRVSDRLLTHKGNYQLQKARTREYSGVILDIFIPGRLPIRGVTPEHPFLRLDSDGNYVWVKANELRIGDELGQSDVFPDLSPSMIFDDLASVDKSKNQFDISTNQNELAYLMGMYLAEGTIQDPKRYRTTYFFLHENELFLAEHIANLICKLNPDINVNYDYIKNTCRHVVVSNSYLAKFIFVHAGKHKAKNKIISTNYLNSITDEAISYLLGGTIDGDGAHQFNSEKRLVYHSSSFNLAYIMSAAMRRLGIAHSFGRRKGGSFKNSQKWSYDLTVNREFEHIIKSIYPRPDFISSSSCGNSQFGLIYDIRLRQYDGVIYNFEVEEDNSYCVQGVLAHNCEDCDFYARLAGGCNWMENRTFDFLHLWHSRTPQWNDHHQQNKDRESKLCKLSIPDRIKMQTKRLIENGWQGEL